jgi:hypothetical protein
LFVKDFVLGMLMPLQQMESSVSGGGGGGDGVGGGGGGLSLVCQQLNYIRSEVREK